MAKVAIVTDSTAYIPRELMNNLLISIVPLQVIFGEQTFLDGVEIQSKQFYEKLQNTKVMPTTSQPTPQAFEKEYRRLLEQGYDILTITISSKLSGTLDSAMQAKKVFPEANIELVDSEVTSMAMGFMVLTVARAAQQGATLAECKALAERGKRFAGALFIPSTLEFLHRGGRIGGAAAFLGTALDLKPLLGLEGGKVVAIERVRTMGKAINRLLDLLVERLNGQKPIHIAALHANAPEDAALLLEKTRERFPVSDVSEAVLAEVSPVIGTHTGPGTVGIAWLAGI